MALFKLCVQEENKFEYSRIISCETYLHVFKIVGEIRKENDIPKKMVLVRTRMMFIEIGTVTVKSDCAIYEGACAYMGYCIATFLGYSIPAMSHNIQKITVYKNKQVAINDRLVTTPRMELSVGIKELIAKQIEEYVKKFN